MLGFSSQSTDLILNAFNGYYLLTANSNAFGIQEEQRVVKWAGNTEGVMGRSEIVVD